MADAEQQFMETAENGYPGEENGAQGYDDGGASAGLQAQTENNGAGDGTQDGDGGRIEASKSEEDAGYVNEIDINVTWCFSEFDSRFFCSLFFFFFFWRHVCRAHSQGDGRSRTTESILLSTRE